ncbi:MAG: hypothetical protein L3K07_05815 [Thermoplasmata archaeon]|nr:hypothetical protein [Thermoplasmata archaeon]
MASAEPAASPSPLSVASAPKLPPAPPSAPPAPPAPPPLSGEIVDHGASRRDTVRTLRWSVHGAAKVLGTVEAGTLDISGMLSVGGELRCGELRVRGSVDTFAPTRVAGLLDLDGAARLGGPVSAGEARLLGRAELTSDLAAERTVDAEGHLAVGGDLSAAELRFSGTLLVTGGIRAGRITGKLDGVCRARSVLCDTIDLKRITFPPWKRSAAFSAERIEAREAHLDGVRCEFLRAEEIYLGPNCHVSRAEGRVVARHRSSYVGYESSSPPPPGLFR